VVVLQRVGSVTEFKDGTITVLDIAGRSIGIVNTGRRFHAVLNVCPHERAEVCRGTLTGTMLPCASGAEVQYGLHNEILRCPWHGYEFDLSADGRAVFTEFRGRLRMFDVVIEDGQVLVDIGPNATED
jgi:3-phenylpropionate/trans-cinnamate dioxygenase ferredoxin subunit